MVRRVPDGSPFPRPVLSCTSAACTIGNRAPLEGCMPPSRSTSLRRPTGVGHQCRQPTRSVDGASAQATFASSFLAEHTASSALTSAGAGFLAGAGSAGKSM